MEENNKQTPHEDINISTSQPSKKDIGLNKGKVALIVFTVVAIFATSIAVAIMLFQQPTSTTSHIRDIFIIFMALESLVIGVSLIILIIQLAILINLLQNEIKPIIDSTSETVNTLRGTVIFLSKNISEPVIKLNEHLAAFKRIIDLVNPRRK